MAWTTPLKLATLPLVLAGPILRKVTETSVTVWFALKQAATVTVTVSNAQGALLTGSGVTCAVGTNLHIVAVTANKIAPANTAGTLLGFGTVYFYDATFAVGTAAPVSLAQATTPPGKTVDPKLSNLAYPPYNRPSFSLPPNDISKLRLIQGSCRHPNGTGGPDCLAMLDDLILQVPTDANLRPHQLVMGGDQIYADDVAGHLLMALTAASDLLLGWQEILTLPADLPPLPGNKVPPYTRKKIGALAGLTSAESYNHLFTLGEYICMYMFVWSDVLWTAQTLPNKADLIAAAGSSPPLGIKYQEFYAISVRADNEFGWVQTFRDTLPKVRRALANIPSYMILDDHDVTDDFNMTPSFCKDVYTAPLGLQIVQNALVAYSLCQHWGNVPEEFFRPEDAPAGTVFGGTPPGRQLLNTLNGVIATTYSSTATTTALRTAVGVHTYAQMAAPPAAVVGAARAHWLSAYHDPGSLVFDYTVESQTHQIIVTDSRTWRSFPPGQEHAELLPLDQILRQIANVTPITDARALIVVLSTNAPPVPGIRQAADKPGTAAFFSSLDYTNDTHPDVFEAWELPSAPFDRLVGAICTRLQPFSGVKTGSAIILSGDVHSSFATRLVVKGANPLGAAIPAEQVNVVIAQMVSSSFRNLTGKTLSQHKEGYSYPSERLVGAANPEGFFGWTSAPATGRIVGFTQRKTPRKEFTFVIVKDVSISQPKTLSIGDISPNGGLVVQPDYKFRLDYLHARKEHRIPDFTADPLPPLPPGDPSWQTLSNRAERFRQIAGNYRRYDGTDGADRQMVGENNISELTFDGRETAFHTVRWFNNTAPDGKPPFLVPTLSTYEIGLGPTDATNPFNDFSKIIPAVVTRPKGGLQ